MAITKSDEKGAIALPAVAVTSQTTKIHEKSSSTDSLSPESMVQEGRNARSSDLSTTNSATAGTLNPFDTDIEAQSKMHTTDTREQTRHFLARSSTNLARGESHAAGAGANDDCQVWPGQAHWKRKAKAAKRKNRACNCLASLSRRNRMIVKILIGLFIIATAVGVGFGISKPLGAQIWKPSSQ